MKNKRLFLLISLIVIVTLCYSSCAAKSADMGMYNRSNGGYGEMTATAPQAMPEMAMNSEFGAYSDYDAAMADEKEFAGESDVSDSFGLKIVYTADVSVQTETFDESYRALIDSVKKYDGYVASSNVYGGYFENDYYYTSSANVSLRIPSERYTEFMQKASDFGTITSCYEYTDDITSTYIDMEARLKSLTTQETRLLELLETAETVADIITIESKLSDIRYQVESYTAQLKTYDNMVAYSTVSVYLQEVTTIVVSPKSFGERVSSAISNSIVSVGEFLKNALIVMIYVLPYLLIIGVIVVVIVLICKGASKRRKEKIAKSPSPAVPAVPVAPAAESPYAKT